LDESIETAFALAKINWPESRVLIPAKGHWQTRVCNDPR
jgi:hypothetical protein